VSLETASRPAGVPGEVVRLESVSKRFGKKVVLDRLSLTLREGEDLAILGKSGSGKSVLLKLITGLLKPDQGRLYLWGQPTEGLGEVGWGPLRRRMGLVFQSGALFDSLSVFENIAFPLRERKTCSEAEIRRLVEERLQWVHLAGAGQLAISELSGGMRRRVALARTLAGSPELMLYDEPTTGLDPITGRKVSSLMRDVDRKLKTSSILVTHDLDCSRTVSSRWAYLAGGSVLADGSPDEFLRSQHAEIREFLAGEDLAQELPPVTSPDAAVTTEPAP
jgi:phospholipid/cholesterol/gamma-HCH transport system ATP-binding protein